MYPFRRPGGFFEIAPYRDIFDGSELGQERMRLWKTYLHEGRGFLEILHLWAEYPTFRALVDQVRTNNRLQAISVAWNDWASDHEDDARSFITAQSTHVWTTLDSTAKATFLAITHALMREGLMDQVLFVTEIRGKLSGIGTTFRLYCFLQSTAPARIQSVFGKSCKGVNYFYEPLHPICYRQSQSAPSFEISTREHQTTLKRKDGTVKGWESDIVIDYREVEFTHLSPDNFDITALSGSHSHFQLHEIRFGGEVPGLNQFRPQMLEALEAQPEAPMARPEPLPSFYDVGIDPSSVAAAEPEPPQPEEPKDILDQID